MKQNLLNGIVRWNGAAQPRRHEDEHFQNEWLDLTVQRISLFDFDEQHICFDAETQTLCAVLGYVANLDDIAQRHGLIEKNDVEIVARLYALRGIQGLTECDGVFFIVLCDEPARMIYLAQSEWGMSLPLYYATDSRGVYFSTSLKRLLQHAPQPRRLNDEAVKQFLQFEHIIPNAATLLQGVQKLLPHAYLQIDWERRSVAVKPLDFPARSVSMTEAKQELLPSIEANLRHLASHLRNQEFVTTFTSGWDTNVMLFTLWAMTDAPMTAVTIDGGNATNELPVTRRILESYSRVRHVTSSIQPNIIDALPNMVWLLEGAVYENGMFLRYELANVFARHGLNAVFLGACADQVMHPETIFKRLARRLPDVAAKDWLIAAAQRGKDRLLKSERWEERELRRKITQLSLSVYSSSVAYHVDIEFLLKMHGLIFNGFGVQGVFPFLNRDTAAYGKALGMANRQKAWYKAKIREKLPPAITQHFQKSGAVVDAPGLVAANQATLLRVLNTPFLRRLLPESARCAMERHPLIYYKLLLQSAYLFLFHELFVSGRFDDQFHRPQIEYSLRQMLEL